MASKVRCDDPAHRCSTQCPTTEEDEDKAVVLAYARNPKQAGGKYPDISFCPEFYGLRNLGNAIAYGSGFSNVKQKNLLDNYEGRGKHEKRSYCIPLLLLLQLSGLFMLLSHLERPMPSSVIITLHFQGTGYI